MAIATKAEVIEWAGFEIKLNSDSILLLDLDDCSIISASDSESGAWELWASESDYDDPKNKIMEIRGESITEPEHVRLIIGAMGVGYIAGHRDGQKKMRHAFCAVFDAFAGRGSPDLIPSIVAETWTEDDEKSWRKERMSFSKYRI